MAGLQMTTLEGSATTIDAAAIDALASSLRGALIAPGAPGYDEARRVWNAMIDRRPGLIVRCAGVADVVRGVAFARRHRLLLAVRGGGHHIGGHAVCDGGLVLDLSPMRAVRVDPIARRAHADGGATLADVDHETQAFGLATPLGINSTTGLAGFTLGGGFGWLSRSLGLAVDNLLAADVVTADAQLVRASADENRELFWAIRGGGGNYGVVTRFELALHPIGPEVLAGLVVFPAGELRAVLGRWRELAVRLPEETTLFAVLRRAPPLPFLPPEVHGTEVVVIAMCHAGDAASGQRALAEVRALGAAIGEHVGPQSYAAWQRALDPLLLPGMRNYWKSHYFEQIEDGVLEVASAALHTLPTDACELIVGVLAGAPGRVPRGATAYSARDARFVLNVHGRWADPADDARCLAWSREVFARLQPFATGGGYVNFMTADEQARVPQAYGSDVYARLAAVKASWDPENLFRVNHNVVPRGADGAARAPGARGAHVVDR